jgi:hypothetical protein
MGKRMPFVLVAILFCGLGYATGRIQSFYELEGRQTKITELTEDRARFEKSLGNVDQRIAQLEGLLAVVYAANLSNSGNSAEAFSLLKYASEQLKQGELTAERKKFAAELEATLNRANPADVRKETADLLAKIPYQQRPMAISAPR